METELQQQVSQLEQELSNTNPAAMMPLHSKIQDLMRRLTRHGLEVPTGLRRINARLIEEAYEDRFDNMPV